MATENRRNKTKAISATSAACDANGSAAGSPKLPVDLENLRAVLMSELTAAITSQLKSAIDAALAPIAASIEGFTAKFEAQDRTR